MEEIIKVAATRESPIFNAPDQFRDLAIECYGFNLFQFWLAAQKAVELERAGKITHLLLVNNGFVLKQSGHCGNYTHEQICMALEDRADALLQFKIFFVQPLEAGWRESSFGSHCVRVAEILNFSPFEPIATLIYTTCAISVIALDKSKLFQTMATQTAWER